MCHYSHLGYDLVALLYSSVLPTVRDENMSDFLETYLSSLTETCSEHSYKGPLPTVDDVRSRVESLSYLSTMTSLSFIPFALASAKTNLQDKVDENMKVLTEEDGRVETEVGEEAMFYYADPYVVELLQYEIKRCFSG